MFDENIDFDCDECGGSGPPPKFMIPPPPRPPFMQELLKCREDDEINSSNYISSSSSSSKSNSNNIFYSNSDINWDNSDMCEAIPILDASYHSSPSLQTSAMIAVFSLLLVLVVLISSLFVWKHKRKVQNFLPCKTNTRGPHIGGGVTVGHSVTYEDPDAHLGHRPLMMRHHHNVEMLTKSVHYPSGYPMTRSPPHLVCNSPGPDPYRSNDNVYEELGPARTSDNESELVQSDDDFAEDELSLPGERNLNKLSPENKNISGPVSTIYHEQCSSTNQQQINGNDRNILLTSTASNYNQRLNNNNNSNNGNSSNTNSNSTPSRLGIFSGVFRNTTGRNNKNNNSNNNIVQQNNRNRCQNHKTLPHNHDELNRLALAEQNCRQQNSNTIQSDVIIPPTQIIYDDAASRNNLMQLAYNHGSNFPPTINSSNIINANRINNIHGQPCYNTLDSEVERRNRINQLHHTPGAMPPVATIYRGTGTERINYSSRYPQPYYTSQPNNILSLQRSRTNPRSLDRRRIIAAISTDEPNYGYAEPVFHEGLLYNTKSNTNTPTNSTILRQPYQSYVLPNYSNTTAASINSGPYRTLNNHHNHYPTFNNQQYYYHPLHPQNLDQQQLYSRDSSFTSDSGYSHQTSSSAGNNRSNNICPNNIHDNRSNNCNKTSNIPINLALPSPGDSGCIAASNINNGPNSLNCMKLQVQQSNNCDKENSNHHHNNKTTSSIPSFNWARTRAANLNSNHINNKKCKDNNSGTTLSLDLVTASSNNATLNATKSIERINCSGNSSGCSGTRIPNNTFENDSSDTERNLQIDNQNLNFNNHTNNCLSSSPNNNNSNSNNNNNNNNSISNNINNNNSINNISSNEINRTVINSESNNSFNNINNNNNSSCKSQS